MGWCFERRPRFRALEMVIRDIRTGAEDIRKMKADILAAEAQIRQLRP